jgi:hypothetical protein
MGILDDDIDEFDLDLRLTASSIGLPPSGKFDARSATIATCGAVCDPPNILTRVTCDVACAPGPDPGLETIAAGTCVPACEPPPIGEPDTIVAACPERTLGPADTCPCTNPDFGCDTNTCDQACITMDTCDPKELCNPSIETCQENTCLICPDSLPADFCDDPTDESCDCGGTGNPCNPIDDPTAQTCQTCAPC